MSISIIPPMGSSCSCSSNTRSRSSGSTFPSPFMNARNCSAIRPAIQCATTRLTCSSSFASCVAPLGLSSTTTCSPKRYSVTENVLSSTHSLYRSPCDKEASVEHHDHDHDDEHARHPGKTFVQLIIYRFEVLQVHLLVENRPIETRHESEEPMVEYGKAEDAADGFETVDVLRVHAGGQVDL